MSTNTENQLKFRCPVCFARENDVVLFRNEKGFYCIKCGFNGTEETVKEMYADLKKKYRLMKTRLTLEEQRDL